MLKRMMLFALLFTLSSPISQYQLIGNEMMNFLKTLLKLSLKAASLTTLMTLECTTFLESAIEYEEDLYLLKLIQDSGKNINDLGSYLDCISIDYFSSTKSTKEIKENLTFLIVHVFPQDNEEKAEYIFGLCAPNQRSLIASNQRSLCTDFDYNLIIVQAFRLFPTQYKISLDSIMIYDMQNTYRDGGYVLFLKLIPLIVIFVMVIMSLISFLPKVLCYPCYRSKSQEAKQKLLLCFYLSKNTSEILSDNSRGASLITNDNGLSIVKGLRGLAMIFFIIGSSFRHLYLSPVKIYVPELMLNFINSFRFVLILFGLRYAKSILFALSSFTLVYKMINHLDDDEELSYYEDIFITDSDNDSDFSINMEDFFGKEKDKNKASRCTFLDIYPKRMKKIGCTCLLFFILRQAHKFIMYAIGLLVFKYSLFEVFSYLSKPSPVWVYLKEAVIDLFDPVKHLLSNLLLASPFSYSTFFSFDLFMMAYNEIFFFLFFSVVIFIGYKWNKRLDVLIILLFIICSIVKVMLYFFLPEYEKESFYPAKVYQKTYYSFILSNPFYNIPSALIGLFFGLVYFCVQNSIKATNSRKFLIIPNSLSSALSTRKVLKVVLLIASLGLFLVCVFLFICVYPYYADRGLAFFEFPIVNIVALFDVDFGLIALFIFIICLFLLGNNIFVSFLSHDYWNFISRPFFLFLVDINIISYYIFYQSEATVNLQMFNILFYSLLIFIVMIVVNALLFIFLEIPLKKLTKLIIKGTEAKRKVKKAKSKANASVSENK